MDKSYNGKFDVFEDCCFYLHHCTRQKTVVLESELTGLGALTVYVCKGYTTVSDLVSILLCHCLSQFSHPSCREGHFWLVQWEEVGTVLYQAWNRVAGKAVKYTES